MAILNVLKGFVSKYYVSLTGLQVLLCVAVGAWYFLWSGSFHNAASVSFKESGWLSKESLNTFFLVGFILGSFALNLFFRRWKHTKSVRVLSAGEKLDQMLLEQVKKDVKVEEVCGDPKFVFTVGLIDDLIERMRVSLEKMKVLEKASPTEDFSGVFIEDLNVFVDKLKTLRGSVVELQRCNDVRFNRLSVAVEPLIRFYALFIEGLNGVVLKKGLVDDAKEIIENFRKLSLDVVMRYVILAKEEARSRSNEYKFGLKSSGVNWKLILIILIVFAVAIFLFMYKDQLLMMIGEKLGGLGVEGVKIPQPLPQP